MFIEVPTSAGAVEAIFARPAGDARVPGLLFCMDAFGLRPRIEEMADRIASFGYAVLAPNLFHRDGRVAEVAPAGPLDTPEGRAAFFEAARPRMARLTPERIGEDVAAYLDYLTGRDDVRTPVGVVGYCMGARVAVRAAGSHPDLVAACAGFHGGGLATDAPDSPHHALATASAELLFGHADADASMPPEAIAKLGDAARAAGLVITNQVYPGAQHGYTMSDTAAYDEEATERHFTELRALLDRTLR